MVVAKNQTPLTDHGQFRDDPLTGFPLEDLDRTEVARGISQVTSHISAPAYPIAAGPGVERATRRESKARWFVGTTMLVVGLLAGYAAAVATSTWNVEGENGPGSSFAADHADSRPQHAEVQATASRSSSGIADVVNDELKSGEPDSRPSEPQSIDSRQRPVSPPTNTVPATEPGVLHLESRPTGAQVHLDDRLVATTPFRLYGVPPGTHTVRMELQGYVEWSTSVNVKAGSLARIAASLEQ